MDPRSPSTAPTTASTRSVTSLITLMRSGLRLSVVKVRFTISTRFPRRTINSNSALTSAIVMFTFEMPTCTPALISTSDAI
ncbi:hypothetical protein RRF57_011245 [Xylaria bambusicola]|uniref:Uncharacterized protein n=1 Tax=Xylaria bambusicola TaxID=326684 RepID=A0AAN7UUJ9_9PEZI